VTGRELADRAAGEWVEIDRVMSVPLGKAWSRRELRGKCKIVVDRKAEFVTFDWPQDQIDFTLVKGNVVTCDWKRKHEVCVTVFDGAGRQVKRRFERVDPGIPG
jgi:hypothetical protein